jgi:hypothetical protein
LSQESIDISKLLSSQREVVSAVRIRGFRAIDDNISCLQFQEGHLDVLRSFGFKVSSTKEDWMYSEDVFVVIVESLCGQRTYGGARIELVNKTRKLPIQTAIESIDDRINQFVQRVSLQKSGELCGLWNSVAVAGLGIGSVYSIRAALSLAIKKNIESLMALCSVHSFKMASNFGFRLVNDIGDGGVVYYEGARQNAHITFQDNLPFLSAADDLERAKIFDLVMNGNQIVTESRNGKLLEIHYEIN